MTISAGELCHRVRIERKVQSRSSGTGAISWTWETIPNGRDWAAIEPLSAREFVAAAAVQSKVTGRIKMRYRGDVTSAMRVVHESKNVAYSIEGPPLADKKSGVEYMTLAVGAGVNLGA